MNIEKAKGYISIAHKAGYLVIGTDKLDTYNQKLYLILLDKNAGKFAQKVAAKQAERANCKLVMFENLAQLIEINNCKICGIKNKELSEKIIENIS